MYICICTPTTDKQIKEAIASGADTLDALKMELGMCCNCCSCQKSIEEILTLESANGAP